MVRRAVVLLGGQGTRLRPLTLTVPKPLLPVANRPMSLYHLALLHACGIKEVVLSIGARQTGFRSLATLGRRLGMTVHLAGERSPLGTAGGIRNAARAFRGREPFFAFNGDILADFDLRAMEKHHRECRAAVTIGLVRVADPSAFGLVVTGADGLVSRFIEKPGQGEAVANTINAGVYLMEPEVLDSIPAGRAVSIERETFPGLLTAGKRVAGWQHDGYWLDVGTLARYLKANADMATAGVPAAFSSACRILPGSHRRPSTLTAEGAAVIGSSVSAGRGACLKGWAVIGDGCVLGADSVVENSVLLPRAVIGAGACVINSVVGAGVVIGASCTVRDCALGDNSYLSDFSVVDFADI